METEKKLQDLESKSDDELIEEVKGLDLAAFDILMQRYEKSIYNLGLRLTRNQEEALEVVQDTFISVFKGIANFRRDSSFKTWIYRIATNAALMLLRKNKRNRDLLMEDTDWSNFAIKPVEYPRWNATPEELFENEELSQTIRDAVEKLPDIYRTAFILRDIEGLSNNETASVLDITLPALKSRVLRARLMMREALSKYMEEKLS